MRPIRQGRAWYIVQHTFQCTRMNAEFILAQCELSPNGTPTNDDLEALGLVMLACMEPATERPRTANSVRRERATNKVFGIVDGEKWSDAKQLMDFMDDLFSLGRQPATKFLKPVGQIHASFDVAS